MTKDADWRKKRGLEALRDWRVWRYFGLVVGAGILESAIFDLWGVLAALIGITCIALVMVAIAIVGRGGRLFR